MTDTGCVTAETCRISDFGFRISGSVGLCVCLFTSVFFVHNAPAASVVINEIHYQPPNRTKFEEFIELHRPAPTPLNLAGWRFANGVEFTFPTGAIISAGGYMVVAADPTAFRARFGFTPLGPWSGRLSNRGERIQLRDATGALVQ